MRLGTFVSILLAGSVGPVLSATEDTVNIRLNPVNLLIKTLSLEVDFSLGESWTLGPLMSGSGEFASEDGTILQGEGFGLLANYYFGNRRFTDSWFLSFWIQTIRLKLKQPIGGIEASAEALVGHGGAVVAYQWFWNSGINLSLGLGIARYQAKETVTLTGSSGAQQVSSEIEIPGLKQIKTLAPALELSLGYSF